MTKSVKNIATHAMLPAARAVARRHGGEPPWSTVAAARSFLRWLVGLESWSPTLREGVEFAAVGRWLVHNGLGPLAYGRSRELWPELAGTLRRDAYSAAAENSLHFQRLETVIEALQEAQIPMVLLKGVALAGPVYADPLTRTMTDVDLWVPQEMMEAAVRQLQGRGFTLRTKYSRPLQLEVLNEGEVQLLDRRGGLVELHGSPLKGGWIRRAATLDKAAMWRRARPFDASSPLTIPLHGVQCLDGEDAILQLAVHTAVNHRFSLHAVRGLVDMVMLAGSHEIDWHVVARRAQAWGVGVAVWTVLDRLQSLVGLDGLQPALTTLRPSWLRRRLLQTAVSPHSLLSGVDHRHSLMRHLLWLLLVDRPSAAARLIHRSLWPEPEWLAARYLDNVNHWQHMWRVLRNRQV